MRSARDLTALTRVALMAAIGVLVGAGVALRAPWQVATLSGWNAAAAVFSLWVWTGVRHKDAAATRRIATVEDDSRSSAELVLVAASLASLVGVGVDLLKASSYAGVERALITSVAVVTVALSWLVVQCVYTLRYAHVFYAEEGGIDFHDGRSPDYGDFAYIAFTLGMTYQVSDTDITSKRIRMIALRQGLLSYLLGIAVVAMTINVVAGLLGR